MRRSEKRWILRKLRRFASALAFTAVLGVGHGVWAQGYVTIGTGTDQYATFYGAYGVGGNSATYTLHDGPVTMGGAMVPGFQPVGMTIQSENDDSRILDLGQGRFLEYAGDSAALTFDKVTLTNGKSTTNGGAITAVKTVTINGTFTFDRNQSEASGGVIFAGDDTATGGLVNISGTGVFSNNSALGAGGVINAETVNISGTNTFSGNSAAGVGGAINTTTLTLSGENTFTGNASNNSDGGAINANVVTFNAGNYTFTGNTAKGVPGLGYPGLGGAVYAAGVTFNGDTSTSAIFSGNTMTTSAGSVRNDIYIDGYRGVTFDGAGTYSFEGGIQMTGGGMTLKNGANVTFESGSINVFDDSLTINGATLNIVLNDKNRYSDTTATSFADGATQFTAKNDMNVIGSGGTMKFVVNNAIQDSWYLGAIGDFRGCLGAIVMQINGGEGLAEIDDDKLDSVIWIGITKGNFLATRKSGGITTQKESNTFDGAFETGSGAAFAANDVVYLADDLNATGEVAVGSGITAFGVVSNSAADVRTITATGTHRFFNVESGTTITLDNVTFYGGNAGSDNHGGAILTGDDNATLTLNSTGSISATFQNNSAVNGGAIEAGTVHLNGKFTFDGNTASLNSFERGGEGGAIDAWNVTLSGTNIFKNNSAVNGGAIWATNLTFEGNDSFADFRGNSASGSGNDIYIAKDWKAGAPGTLTFNDNGTYGLLNGVYVDGITEMNDSVKVTFGQSSRNTMNGAMTFNDSSSILFSALSTSAINGDLTINDSASVIFGYDSDTTISGKTTMNAQQVSMFANIATLKLNGGLTLGDGVKQKFANADVTLGGTLGVTYDGDPNSFNSQADFSSVNTLTVTDGTKFAIYDTNGNELTAKNFAGKVLGSNSLVLGDGSDALKKIVPTDFSYESILYSVELVYDNSNILLKSEMKAVDPMRFEGNTVSAVELYGEEALLDVSTDAEIWDRTNGATGETYGSAAHAQLSRLTYLNQRMASDLLADASSQFGGVMLGQNPDGTDGTSGTGCCDTAGRHVWGNSYYFGGNAQTHHRMNGYDYDSAGLNLGMTWASDTATLGFFYGYGQTDVDATASDVEVNEHTVGLFARWDSRFLGGYTLAIGEISFGQNDFTRRFDAVYASDYDSFEGGLYLEKGWKQQFAFASVNPFAALQYLGYHADGFSDAVLTADAFDFNSLRSILGARLERSFSNLRATAGLAWQHEFLDSDASFGATTVAGSQIIFANGSGRDFAEVMAGVGWNLSENVTISGDYYLFFNEHSAMNAGMGTVTVKF